MDLIAKMKISPDEPLALVDAPEILLPLFPHEQLIKALPAGESCRQVVFFPRNTEHLDAVAPAIMRQLRPDGLLWIAYPKKSGAIQSDLIRDEGWNTMYQSDWEGVASISIDHDWSGVRFRHKSARKKGKRRPPATERKTEGIDYINRTVSLPGDAREVMRSFEGLEAFFNTLSFTCRKEYVEAIAEAKKPETRARRIEKMIVAVTELKEKKAAKTKKK